MIRYIRSTILPSKPAQLLLQTGLKWDRDNCPSMAAALSYHALFSLFPMLLLILSIISPLIGANTEAFQHIKEAIERFLPPEVHDLIKETIVALNENSAGAGIIGFGLLLWTASTVFTILRNSVNKIWRSHEPNSEPQSIWMMVFSFITNQLLAFLLVFGIALLLLSSLISKIAIETI
jgi:membrane protein